MAKETNRLGKNISVAQLLFQVPLISEQELADLKREIIKQGKRGYEISNYENRSGMI